MGKLLSFVRIALVSLMMVLFVFVMVPLHLVFGFSTETGFRIRSLFCQLCFWIMGVRLEVEGEPVHGQGPYLIVCNHRSLMDPFIGARYVYAYFLGKAELSKYPFFGYGARLTGAIFVQRDKKSSRSASRVAISKALEEGYNVLLYPEGTTSAEPTTKQFFKGTFEIAEELGVKVVPLVLEYKNRDHYWTDGGMMAKSVEQLSSWKMNLRLWIGEPISSGPAMEVLEMAQRRMNEKILEIHRDWGNI